jgi:hypothetical protein
MFISFYEFLLLCKFMGFYEVTKCVVISQPLRRSSSSDSLIYAMLKPNTHPIH